jgi:pyridoxamine 5'-phosphate oxidase
MSFEMASLPRGDGEAFALPSDPLSGEAVLELIRAAVVRARQHHPAGDVPVALATADADGNPSVRMVLIKDVDERGVVLYTNMHSRKGRELRDRGRAALVIHIREIGQQLRVEGPVEEVERELSDAYWASRPRGYQLAGRASAQSDAIASRDELLERVEAEGHRFASDQPVPRPEHWAGQRILPDCVELWRHCDDRLHERHELRLEGGTWERRLLAP